VKPSAAARRAPASIGTRYGEFPEYHLELYST
jgi:hypothetical protein